MPQEFVTPDGRTVSEAGAIKEYFGMKPEQKISDFMAEIKALTPEAKTELAVGAAKELGWTIKA